MTIIPADVIKWFREVFRTCNERISEKITNGPNTPEEQLDLTWIEHLSRFASPITLPSSWTVKIQTHYLGGLRHFNRWEVADIGVLLFIRRGGQLERCKVALLQSKRLYPTNSRVSEELNVDYEIGFARLADPEDLARSIATEAEFKFSDSSKYGALLAGSDQVAAITEYEQQSNLRIYYQLYNPWSVPLTQRVPLSSYQSSIGELTHGVRILPSSVVHEVLAAHAKGAKPMLSEFAVGERGVPAYGWPLESFITDEFLSCREGSVFETISDQRIERLFYRRSGPIAAAIAITIEAPDEDG
jgi:hypothetical protein